MSIFFYFRNSPFPKDQLLLFGNDKLNVLTNSEEMLNRMDCNSPFMMLLLPEIKIHLARRVPIDPDMSYHDLWQKAILEDRDDFRNIVKVKDCSFYPSPHIWMWGDSLCWNVSRLIGEEIFPPQNWMHIKLCGPGVNRTEDVDPVPGDLLRWDVGTMQKAYWIQPYGLDRRQMNGIVHGDDNQELIT